MPQDFHIQMTASARDAVSRMHEDAMARIAAYTEGKITESFKEGANIDTIRHDIDRFTIDTWKNVADTLTAMIRLGGMVTREDDRNLFARAEHICYGVNQSSHNGTWSINS